MTMSKFNVLAAMDNNKENIKIWSGCAWKATQNNLRNNSLKTCSLHILVHNLAGEGA